MPKPVRDWMNTPLTEWKIVHIVLVILTSIVAVGGGVMSVSAWIDQRIDERVRWPEEKAAVMALIESSTQRSIINAQDIRGHDVTEARLVTISEGLEARLTRLEDRVAGFHN